MTALRCTAKLAKSMRRDLTADPAPASNRLGEWTANLIRIGRTHLILAVNERTRLGLAIEAAPYAGVPARFCQQLFKSLLALGVEPDQAAAEAGLDAHGVRALELALGAGHAEPLLLRYRSLGALRGRAVRRRDQPAPAGRIVLEPRHIDLPAERVREAFGLPCKPAQFFRQAANDAR